MGAYYPVIDGLNRTEISAKYSFPIYFDQPVTSFKIEWRFPSVTSNMQLRLLGAVNTWPEPNGFGDPEFTISSSIVPGAMVNGSVVTYTCSQPTRKVTLQVVTGGDGADVDNWAILHPVS